MNKALKILLAALVVSSLSACVIAPPYGYPYYGEPSRHHHQGGRWRHR